MGRLFIIEYCLNISLLDGEPPFKETREGAGSVSIRH